MFVKTRQFAIARWRHAAPAPLALPHANDNHVRRVTVSQPRRRPLACHWQRTADGRLECRWQIDRVDLSAAEDPDQCWCERVWSAGGKHLPSEERAKACGKALLLLPSPLRAGVGGGGRETWHVVAATSRPPTPAFPHKGGGRRRGGAACDDVALQGRVALAA